VRSCPSFGSANKIPAKSLTTTAGASPRALGSPTSSRASVGGRSQGSIGQRPRHASPSPSSGGEEVRFCGVNAQGYNSSGIYERGPRGKKLFVDMPQSRDNVQEEILSLPSPLQAQRISPGTVDKSMDVLFGSAAGTATWTPPTPRRKGPASEPSGRGQEQVHLPPKKAAPIFGQRGNTIYDAFNEPGGTLGAVERTPSPSARANALLSAPGVGHIGGEIYDWDHLAGDKTWQRVFRGPNSSNPKFVRRPLEMPHAGRPPRRCWSEPPADKSELEATAMMIEGVPVKRRRHPGEARPCGPSLHETLYHGRVERSHRENHYGQSPSPSSTFGASFTSAPGSPEPGASPGSRTNRSASASASASPRRLGAASPSPSSYLRNASSDSERGAATPGAPNADGEFDYSNEDPAGQQTGYKHVRKQGMRTQTWGTGGYTLSGRAALYRDLHREGDKLICDEYARDFDDSAGRPTWHKRTHPLTTQRAEGKRSMPGFPQTRSEIEKVVFQHEPGAYYGDTAYHLDFEAHQDEHGGGAAAGQTAHHQQQGCETKIGRTRPSAGVIQGLSRGHRSWRRKYDDEYGNYFDGCAGERTWYLPHSYAATNPITGNIHNSGHNASYKSAHRGVGITLGRVQHDPTLIAKNQLLKTSRSVDDLNFMTTRCDHFEAVRGKRRMDQVPLTKSSTEAIIFNQPNHRGFQDENNYSRYMLPLDDDSRSPQSPNAVKLLLADFGGAAGQSSFEERPQRNKGFTSEPWGCQNRSNNITEHNPHSKPCSARGSPHETWRSTRKEAKRQYAPLSAGVLDPEVQRALTKGSAGFPTFVEPVSGKKHGPTPRSSRRPGAPAHHQQQQRHQTHNYSYNHSNNSFRGPKAPWE